MHAGRNFSLGEAIVWTRREIYWFIVIAAVPTVLYEVFQFRWITIPWLPVALIGTAEAFLIGFKNNASYDRLWEARKIWGGIVNTSRTWAIMSRDFVTAKHSVAQVSKEELSSIHRRLIYRHMAWLTALRYQLRETRAWESMHKKYNIEYRRFFKVPELEVKLEDELKKFLPKEEMDTILLKKNRSSQLLSLQSEDLKSLLERGLIEDFRHMEMENRLSEMFDHQGMCERIKNFPYPRQFATMNHYFVWLFILLVPVGMLPEFDELGGGYSWLTIPFSVLVCWVFHTMEKIGEATENPFQGGANDVPMASLCRTIEIDLREMLDEKEIPAALVPENHILM